MLYQPETPNWPLKIGRVVTQIFHRVIAEVAEALYAMGPGAARFNHVWKSWSGFVACVVATDTQAAEVLV